MSSPSYAPTIRSSSAACTRNGGHEQEPKFSSRGLPGAARDESASGSPSSVTTAASRKAEPTVGRPSLLGMYFCMATWASSASTGSPRLIDRLGHARDQILT